MNSRERVMTAIRGGIPDTVPIMELTIEDAVIQQIMRELTGSIFMISLILTE